MFQAYKKKQTTLNYRKQMNKPEWQTITDGYVQASGHKVYEMVKR